MKRILFPITVNAKTPNNIFIGCFVDTEKTIPFDFDGYSFIAEIKAKATDVEAISTFVVSAEESEAFPSVKHVIRLFLSYESSSSLNGVKKPVWDILCIPPAGIESSFRPYLPSNVTILNGVSD